MIRLHSPILDVSSREMTTARWTLSEAIDVLVKMTSPSTDLDGDKVSWVRDPGSHRGFLSPPQP